MTRTPQTDRGEVAFVLGGGGGPVGAHEVGMLRALVERGIVPDPVLGTSIGAINGMAVAADPSVAGVKRLAGMWSDMDLSEVFDGSVLGRVTTLARTRTHLHGNESLRRLLTKALPVSRIEELAVRISAWPPASSAHRSTGSSKGRSSRPSWRRPRCRGSCRPSRSPASTSSTVASSTASPWVARSGSALSELRSHVGRLDRPLAPPRWPWEVALVAFKIARRHRFIGDLAALPAAVDVHVLPTGQPSPPRYTDISQFRYRDASNVAERIARAHRASSRYLEDHEPGPA